MLARWEMIPGEPLYKRDENATFSSAMCATGKFKHAENGSRKAYSIGRNCVRMTCTGFLNTKNRENAYG